MRAYCSRTGTRRNLAAMRAEGWGLLISRTGAWRHEGFEYVLDNGRWSDSQEVPPRPFDKSAQADFIKMVDQLGANAKWVVIPDTVGDREETLQLAQTWIPRLRGKCPLLLIAVQDEMAPGDIEHLMADDIGIFVGGSTEYKLSSLEMWASFCAQPRRYLHVGRVNTARRIRAISFAEPDSWDGSSGARFAVTIPTLANASRASSAQIDMFSQRRLA